MLTRRSFTSLLGAAIAAPVAAAGDALPATSRADELRQLRQFAESTHPRGAFARDDPEWRTRWSRVQTAAHDLTDGEFLVQVRRALAWFRDGHTTLLPFEYTGVPTALARGAFSLSLPLQLRAFDDGLYVVAARDEASSLLGAAVERMNGRSAGALLRAMATDWPGNDAWAQRWAGASLASPAQLQGLGLVERAEAPVEITASIGGGARVARADPRAATDGAFTPFARPLREHERWAASEGSGNYLRDLGAGVWYVSIDEMADVEGRTFVDLTRAIVDALDRSTMRRLIVDLRRNGGGNNYFGEPLRRSLARSRLNRPGGVYVLIGPQTFSAAQNLANRLERETFARFVGTPTGGAPNHYGDAQPLVGPATGITAIVSSLPWFDSYPQDTRPWLVPDVLVPDTFAEWSAGRDPALELARTETVDAPADELASERVFYFRRASQSRAWTPFWRA
jgi:hypothetical protein